MSELRVVFLGTSSGKPTLYRNVSAVTVTLGGQLVLFDCGEGTQLQFIRAGLKPSRLVLACISHFHGDHINGLPGMLSTMALNQHEKSVALAGPRGLRDYFNVLKRLGVFNPRFPIEMTEIDREGVVFEAELFRVVAARLNHRIETWGFRFEERARPGRFDVDAARKLGVPAGPLFGRLQRGETIELPDGAVVRPEQVLGPPRSGRTVAYIPDTRPCAGGVELGRDADVLIHEATYRHELAVQARKRGHSTVVQAAEVAREAGAKRLVLTHISPKHDDPRPILAEARAVFENTILAKDLMSIDVEWVE